MKKILFALLLLPFNIFAANEPFKTFLAGSPSATALSGAELMYCDQSNASTKCTPSQLLSYVLANAVNLPANGPTITDVCDATCGNLSLTGLQTVDGFAATANSTITLLTAQSTASQNGPWVQQTGAWTRPAWYATGNISQVNGYTQLQARQGNNYKGIFWKQTNTAAITVDTTSTTWAVVSLALNSTTINAGSTIPTADIAAGALPSGVTIQTTQVLGPAINAQTGTSYAFLTTDGGKLVTFSNAAATAVSLSSATTTGFTAGYSFDVQNKGAGTVTITPATSTINGTAALVIGSGFGCSVTSDGTNYQVSGCTALTGLPTAHSVPIGETGTSTFTFIGGCSLGVLAWTNNTTDPTCATNVTLGTINASVSFRTAQYQLNGIEWQLNSAPTTPTGFCTAPAINATFGTPGFSINVGTVCAASTGGFTMPFAGTHGWLVRCEDFTSNSSLVIGQTAGATTAGGTTVGITAYSRTTGLATNFNSSDVLTCTATPY